MWNALVTALSTAKRQSYTPSALGRKEARGDGRSRGSAADGDAPKLKARGGGEGGSEGGGVAARSSKSRERAEGKADGKESVGKEGGGKEGGGKGKDPGGSSLEGAEEQEEDDYDDRFAAVRGRLAKALLRRQRELCETLCGLCKSPLLQPTRLLKCRHALCALCVERSIFYHRECPVCMVACGPPMMDVEHDAAMRLRMATLRDEPLMVTAWRAKLSDHITERRTSLRLVLEYGSTLVSTAESTPRRCRANLFIALLKAVGGELAHRGDEYRAPSLGQLPESVIQQVVLNFNPDSSNGDDECTACLSSPSKQTAERVDYTWGRHMRRGAACHFTVHWAADLGVAPLEIRHKLGRVPTGTFVRRIVVQLPDTLPVLQKEKCRFAAPVTYAERRGKEASGWVTYLSREHAKTVGTSARVTIGAAAPPISASSANLTVAPAAMAATRLAIAGAEANAAVALRIGSIGESQIHLALAASHGAPLGSAADGHVTVGPQAGLGSRRDRNARREAAAVEPSPPARMPATTTCGVEAGPMALCKEAAAAASIGAGIDGCSGPGANKGGGAQGGGSSGFASRANGIKGGPVTVALPDATQLPPPTALALGTNVMSPPSPPSPPLSPSLPSPTHSRSRSRSPERLAHHSDHGGAPGSVSPELEPVVDGSNSGAPFVQPLPFIAVSSVSAAPKPSNRKPGAPVTPVGRLTPPGRASPPSLTPGRTSPPSLTPKSSPRHSSPRPTPPIGPPDRIALSARQSSVSRPPSPRSRNSERGASNAVGTGSSRASSRGKPRPAANRPPSPRPPRPSTAPHSTRLGRLPPAPTTVTSAPLPALPPHPSQSPLTASPSHAAVDTSAGAPLLMQSAASCSDPIIVSLYEQMLQLVGPDAPAALRRIFLAELTTGVACDEPLDFFHVAIDLPGHGHTRTSLQVRVPVPASHPVPSTSKLRHGGAHECLSPCVMGFLSDPSQAKRRAEDVLVSGDFLSDCIKALGKHYAFMIVASGEGAAAVFEALAEQPNMCSFLCIRDPKASLVPREPFLPHAQTVGWCTFAIRACHPCLPSMRRSRTAPPSLKLAHMAHVSHAQVRDMESLHGVFQPVLLAVEGRGQQAALAARMKGALLHASIAEFSRVTQPKYLDNHLPADLLTFLRARLWRGHLPGHGHSNKRPLLTKLVGGMRMWRGERSYQEQHAKPRVQPARAGSSGTPAPADGAATHKQAATSTTPSSQADTTTDATSATAQPVVQFTVDSS